MAAEFPKTEHLKSRKAIELLFKSGQTVAVFPLRLLWQPASTEQAFPFLMTFSVSKRNFKRAVDRNRLRRRMREAYRLQKESLFLQDWGYKMPQLQGMLLYTAKSDLPYSDIEKAMAKLLKWLPDQHRHYLKAAPEIPKP